MGNQFDRKWASHYRLSRSCVPPHHSHPIILGNFSRVNYPKRENADYAHIIHPNTILEKRSSLSLSSLSHTTQSDFRRRAAAPAARARVRGMPMGKRGESVPTHIYILSPRRAIYPATHTTMMMMRWWWWWSFTASRGPETFCDAQVSCDSICSRPFLCWVERGLYVCWICYSLCFVSRLVVVDFNGFLCSVLAATG